MRRCFSDSLSSRVSSERCCWAIGPTEYNPSIQRVRQIRANGSRDYVTGGTLIPGFAPARLPRAPACGLLARAQDLCRQSLGITSVVAKTIEQVWDADAGDQDSKQYQDFGHSDTSHRRIFSFTRVYRLRARITLMKRQRSTAMVTSEK